MPNHVITRITAPKHVLDTLTDEKGAVTFETVAPSPSNKETDNCSGQHEEGIVCWRSWNVDNWGTKWDAYDVDRQSDNVLVFQTAWSHPFPVIQALMVACPGESIFVEYADEDLGNNCGTYQVRNDVVTDLRNLSGTDDGHEMASRMHYGMSWAEVQKEWGDD